METPSTYTHVVIYNSISVVVSYRHFYLQAVHIHTYNLLVMSTYEVPTADPAGLRAIH